METKAKLLLELAEKIKSNTGGLDVDVHTEIYEQAEEVMMAKGAVLFEEEFEQLVSVVQNNKPFELNINEGIVELHAWKELMKRALDANVVDNLTEEQEAELLRLCGTYDDGVDCFVIENKDTLTAKQIAQIYIAQTVSFYYVFSEDEADSSRFLEDDVLGLLLAV